MVSIVSYTTRAFSVITNLRMELFGALMTAVPPAVYPGHGAPGPGSPMSVRSGLVPSSPYLTMRPHPHHLHHQQYIQVQSKLELQTKVREDLTITVKTPTRVFSRLKGPISTFTFKTLCKTFI